MTQGNLTTPVESAMNTADKSATKPADKSASLRHAGGCEMQSVQPVLDSKIWDARKVFGVCADDNKTIT